MEIKMKMTKWLLRSEICHKQLVRFTKLLAHIQCNGDDDDDTWLSCLCSNRNILIHWILWWLCFHCKYHNKNKQPALYPHMRSKAFIDDWSIFMRLIQMVTLKMRVNLQTIINVLAELLVLCFYRFMMCAVWLNGINFIGIFCNWRAFHLCAHRLGLRIPILMSKNQLRRLAIIFSTSIFDTAKREKNVA